MQMCVLYSDILVVLVLKYFFIRNYMSTNWAELSWFSESITNLDKKE